MPFNSINLQWNSGELDGSRGVSAGEPRGTCGHLRSTRNAKSQGIMGEYYENGLCSPRQPQRARRFYARAAAAGDARAQYNLGRVLFHGLLGQKVQPARALDLWQKSAAQKFPAALHAIGFCHEKGHESFKINPMAAKRYYTMAAELLDSRAAFNLGLMYEKGNIFCEDETERFDFAAHWFETAENLGHVRASERLGALRNARRKSERLLQIHAQISGDAAPDAPGGGGSASDNEGPDRKNKDREAKNKDAPVSAHILGPDEP
mmetsp:Transcript_1278/g.4516  ORF Transcript_1278/g.4516 Transcript_1278/m.4516 type:complete len:263 (+) Transcript_1278:242-1030(+)